MKKGEKVIPLKGLTWKKAMRFVRKGFNVVIDGDKKVALITRVFAK